MDQDVYRDVLQVLYVYKERRHKFLRVQTSPLQVPTCADKSTTVLTCVENPPQGRMYAEQSATTQGMLAAGTTPRCHVLGCTTPSQCMLECTTSPCCVRGRFKQVTHLRALPYKFSVEIITEQFCVGTHYFTMVCAKMYYSSPWCDEGRVHYQLLQNVGHLRHQSQQDGGRVHQLLQVEERLHHQQEAGTQAGRTPACTAKLLNVSGQYQLLQVVGHLHHQLQQDDLVPRLYEYAPVDEELHKTEDEEKQAGRRMFDFVVVQGTYVINGNEWLTFFVKHAITKAATLTTHPILVKRNIKEFKALANATLDVDTNEDYLVSREPFSKLIEMATSIPRLYGYVTTKMELYMTEDEKEQAEGKMFNPMDFKGPDVTTVDEWLHYRMKHIIAKAATPATHPILVQRSEEEIKAFADANNFRHRLLPQRGDRRGLPPQHGDYKVLNLIHINKYYVLDDVPQLAKADNFRQGLLPQHGCQPDARDILPPADVDERRQGLLPQYGGHLNGLWDVSQPAEVDNGRQGLLPLHGRHLDGPHDVLPPPETGNGHQGLSLNGEVNTFTELRRGDKRGDMRGDRRRKQSHATM